MKRIALIIVFISAIFLFNTCALEIANVIGPDGGYVFYDKGSYAGGWRYIQCSPFDFGELKGVGKDSIMQALALCDANRKDWYTFGWELPDEADLSRMLECFSYGLTRFSSDYYYLAVNRKDNYDPANLAEGMFEAVILHKNFDNKANGEIEKVENFTGVIRIRAIRRF